MTIYNNVYSKYCLKMKNTKMPINETKDFIFETIIKELDFRKKAVVFP